MRDRARERKSVLHPIARLSPKAATEAGAVDKAMIAHFTAIPAFVDEVVAGSRGGIAEIGVVQRINPDRTRRQMNFSRKQRFIRIRPQRREVKVRHIVQRLMLW